MGDLKLRVYAQSTKYLQTLMNALPIFDIGIEFEICKCGILVIKKGKYEQSEGIHLPLEEEIKEIGREEGTSIWLCERQME